MTDGCAVQDIIFSNYTMKLQPIGNQVVVKPVEAETTTASGIIIPDTAKKEKSERGEVVAVGPGAQRENGSRSEMEVSTGDMVLFKSWEEPIEIDGEDYLVISESDIKAIIK
jgi:chaperonin GroES